MKFDQMVTNKGPQAPLKVIIIVAVESNFESPDLRIPRIWWERSGEDLHARYLIELECKYVDALSYRTQVPIRLTALSYSSTNK